MITVRRESHNTPRDARAGGRLLYAIGDVHGCYDLLHVLLGEIGRDAVKRDPVMIPLVILCGDYIDRGPASSKVLAALAWLVRSTAVEARLLDGNHEDMLRRFLSDPEEYGEWLELGGRQTLQSYGIVDADYIPPLKSLTALRDALLDVMPTSHHLLLHCLEPMIKIGAFTFVHAGVMPGVPLDKQNRDDLLWIREEFLDHTQPADSIIVHGHTWRGEQATILPHRIGIDTGAYKSGVLTGICIADDTLEVIQAVRS